jgi:hypothetical protein
LFRQLPSIWHANAFLANRSFFFCSLANIGQLMGNQKFKQLTRGYQEAVPYARESRLVFAPGDIFPALFSGGSPPLTALAVGG